MKKLFVASLMTAALLLPLQAFAGDTTEVIDKDTLEVDPTFSIDGMGDSNNVNTGVTVVYGVLDGFNINASVGYGANEGLAGGHADLGLGMLWTPLDTDHFDLDVMLDFSYGFGGAWGGAYSLTPGVELNYDLEPDTALWGLYLRFGLPISGDYVKKEDVPTPKYEAKADVGISLTLGTYFTFAEVHQILLEGGFEVENLAKNLGDTGIVEPFISLGYNVGITDSFELTTELAFNLPSDNDNFSATLTIGGIFGLLNK
ncbi:MAG: hypothetical protein IJ165_02730 [Proteobacteria bacterium]|nr:hypothetical protein [Pseudomonadota bacterium]